MPLTGEMDLETLMRFLAHFVPPGAGAVCDGLAGDPPDFIIPANRGFMFRAVQAEMGHIRTQPAGLFAQAASGRCRLLYHRRILLGHHVHLCDGLGDPGDAV